MLKNSEMIGAAGYGSKYADVNVFLRKLPIPIDPAKVSSCKTMLLSFVKEFKVNYSSKPF